MGKGRKENGERGEKGEESIEGVCASFMWLIYVFMNRSMLLFVFGVYA